MTTFILVGVGEGRWRMVGSHASRRVGDKGTRIYKFVGQGISVGGNRDIIVVRAIQCVFLCRHDATGFHEA